MKLIAGLGNPGARYARTRHNLGFDVLDSLAQRLGCAFDREKHQGLIAETMEAGEKVMLVKPQTFMNLSGDCVAALARNKIFDPADILVVVDDINLPLGRVRLRMDGSAGGHNGLKSLIERLGTKDFHRLRLGVGDERKSAKLADHVLSKFHPDEFETVTEMSKRAEDAILLWIKEGGTAAMNAYNR